MLSLLPARQKIVAAVAFATCVLVYLTFRPPSFQDQTFFPASHLTPSRPHDEKLYHVQNDSLGFQEIFMISLPTRTDKRDTFAMQAALSGIKYTQVDGVDGNYVPAKALPHTMDQSANVIGCWRAHMNALQQIVHQDVATALVFEDDADWDVALKQQLVQFARGTRYISNATEPERMNSPYGDDWDMLWLGHCGTWFHEHDNRRVFVIPNDPTVEPPTQRELNVEIPDMSHWDEGEYGNGKTRIVFNSKGGVCTPGYAISQRGARKALYHMSMIPYNSPVDWGYANMCTDPNIDFTCISVYPQIIGVSRPTANTSKNTDIGYGSDADRVVEEARSLHIVYSTRLNMDKLIKGETVFDSQYPDITGPQMDIEDIGAAVGHVEVLREEDVPKKKED